MSEGLNTLKKIGSFALNGLQFLCGFIAIIAIAITIGGDEVASGDEIAIGSLLVIAFSVALLLFGELPALAVLILLCGLGGMAWQGVRSAFDSPVNESL